ncbi:hypothetical protein MNBD_GAMMA22-2647 [hydrothermal vent metagenome]|uniref:Putative DNA-binding domain-containing protein n=1 Tax=hydrothermal vent metagenome TaxID=652676 RepID=A0A3B1ABM2_9ZZZZ
MLRKIQQQFLDGLFSQDNNPEIISVISESGPRTTLDQFMSYRDSVIGGIIEALTVSYPVVKALVGEQFFNHISYQYIRKTPSKNPDLNCYGSDFAIFLDNLDNLQTVPYLSDVARLEWAWQKIISGDKTKTGSLNLLATLEESAIDNIQFELSPHSSLLQSNYAIDKIWQTNQKNVTNDFDNSYNINTSVNLFIWRLDLDMKISLIEPEQYIFLKLIQHKKIFSDVCEEYHQHFPDDDIGVVLSNCIQANWIHSFKVIP